MPEARDASAWRIPLVVFLLLLGMPCVVGTAGAQDAGDVRVRLGGLIQAESNYGWISRGSEERDRLGFGLRRTRLRVNAEIGPKAGAFIHLDADGGTFGILDAFVSYQANPRLRFRLGRMAGAQPSAFIPTPVVAMDTNERAAIALLWHQGTLGHKGRDFGIDLLYTTPSFDVTLFVHNGFGSFDALLGTYQPNIIGDVTGGREHTIGDFAISAAGAVRPNQGDVELGGYVGFNGSENPNTVVNNEGRSYMSYSAHAYWGALPGSRPLRLKADLIGVSYEELSTRPQQNTLGLSFLAAVAVHHAAEVFGRIEWYDSDVDIDNTTTYFPAVGFSFSPSRLRGRPYAQERITLAYNARVPDDGDDPLHQMIILQVQFNF